MALNQASDLVSERVKIHFPHILSGRNENTLALNNNKKMNGRLSSTKDSLFCLQNTVGGKGKGTLRKMTHIFLAEVMTTHMIQ